MTRLAPGIINGRYEVHQRLGRGRTAEVYLARDQKLDRAVAVKVLFPALATDPGFVERFRREAQSAAVLSHPNIVSVYDWGEANGTYFIVMEYVEGESLAELIAREGRVPANRAAEVAVDIASALGFAHRNGGVVHRAVEPGNVLIGREGGVKVGDFGIAGALGDAVGPAPGADVDPRSDVYGLGCVLYETIVGRPPFSGENAATDADADAAAVPVAPRRIDPAIPETLEAIVLKTLAKNPANRYPSAHDMRADLRRYLEGARIAAPPTAAPPADPDATEIMSGVDHTAPTETMKRTTVVPPRRVAGDRDGGGGGDVVDDDDRDEMPPRPYAVLVVLVVLTLIMVGLLFLVTRSSGGDETSPATTASGVTVPRVVDMRQGDAEAALQAANLVPEVVTAAHDTVAIGIVIEQSPAANESAEPGSEVTVTVSSGPATIAIPDLTGKTRDEAMQALTDLAFVPSPKEVESATVAEGLVVGTNPPAGTAAARGATVEIQVSAGSNTTAVPDVTSQPEAQARATLEAAGFAVTTTPQPSDTVAPGLVIGTNPAAGTMAPNGSMITVIVSGGGGGGGGQVGVVPDVVGQDEDDARRQLEEAGFVVTTTEQPTDRRRWDGRVLSQSLPGGTPSPPGSVITIVIGRSQDFDFG